VGCVESDLKGSKRAHLTKVDHGSFAVRLMTCRQTFSIEVDVSMKDSVAGQSPLTSQVGGPPRAVEGRKT